jgi:cytochrome c-type biogenesis protein CcmH/NrfG
MQRRRAWGVVAWLGLAAAVAAELTAPATAAPRRPARRKAAAAPAAVERLSPEQKMDAEERLRIGREAFEKQQYKDAEMAFSSVLTFDPRNPDALAGAAEAAFENAHYDQALTWAERAVWEAPNVKNFTLLGHADAKLGMFEQARVAYAKALGLLPDDPDLKEWLRRTDVELAKPPNERIRLPAR